MGRRILNRKELRDEYDAAERRTEDEDEELDEDEESDEEELDAEEVEEEKPKKKRKAPVKRKPRSRAAKVIRMRVVWGVFDNSHKCVTTYPYGKKKEAEEHAAKLTASKTNNVHFVNPVKEAIEEE